MSTYTRRRIRLAIDVTSENGPTDQLTGATPYFWRATDIAFELAAFFGDASNGGELLEITNISSLTLAIKPYDNRTGTPLMSATINAADFVPGMTLEAWNAKTGYQIIVPFTAVETAVAISGTELNLWCVISVVTTDDPGRTIAWAAFPIKAMESGMGGTNAPVNDPNYYTAVQSDARYPIKTDGAIPLTAVKLRDRRTGLYFLVGLETTADGGKQLVYGESGEALE